MNVPRWCRTEGGARCQVDRVEGPGKRRGRMLSRRKGSTLGEEQRAQGGGGVQRGRRQSRQEAPPGPKLTYFPPAHLCGQSSCGDSPEPQKHAKAQEEANLHPPLPPPPRPQLSGSPPPASPGRGASPHRHCGQAS